MSVGIGILIFVVAFIGGVASKFVIKPAWTRAYSVTWSDELGTRELDIPYGDGEANTFDLYLPKDNTKEYYGLVVYLHAGGFTSGDKSDDINTLSWLCSKGYVACGINYTLRTETNDASVLTQSNEIKAAIPQVVEAAEQAGYSIDKMAIAGGSAGHTLAMLYAYHLCLSFLPSGRSARLASTRRTGTTTGSIKTRMRVTKLLQSCSARCSGSSSRSRRSRAARTSSA